MFLLQSNAINYYTERKDMCIHVCPCNMEAHKEGADIKKRWNKMNGDVIVILLLLLLLLLVMVVVVVMVMMMVMTTTEKVVMVKIKKNG